VPCPRRTDSFYGSVTTGKAWFARPPGLLEVDRAWPSQHNTKRPADGLLNLMAGYLILVAFNRRRPSILSVVAGLTVSTSYSPQNVQNVFRSRRYSRLKRSISTWNLSLISRAIHLSLDNSFPLVSSPAVCRCAGGRVVCISSDSQVYSKNPRGAEYMAID